VARRKYPDIRKKFKVGDSVCMTYHYPGERKKKYRGTVVTVKKDAIDARWEPSGRVVRSWDWAVFEGSGFSSRITKCKRKK